MMGLCISQMNSLNSFEFKMDIAGFLAEFYRLSIASWGALVYS